MKKFVLIVLALMLSVVSVSALSVPEINVTMISQDPDPAGPGEYVDIRFKVQNFGSAVADDLELMLEPEYPFSLDLNENPVRSLGTLPPTGSSASTNVVIVKYKVRVDKDAVEGMNDLHLKYKIGNMPYIKVPYDVMVQTLDSTLSIESVISEPELISPGEKATVKIRVKNMADSVIKDVTLKLDLTFETMLSQVTSTTATGLAAYEALPFAPMGSATEKKINSIDPGEEVVFSYDLIAYSDAESKVYKVPIQIDYFDELETQNTKNDIIGLIVGSEPDISVLVDSTDLILGKKNGKVVIKIVNKGFTDMKFVNLELEETNDFEIMSPREVYIGSVDSDDYETADFSIFYKKEVMDGDKEHTIKLPVNLEYKDANGNDYQKAYTLDLDVYGKEKLGLGNGNKTVSIIVFIVLVLLAIILFRRFRKKKK